MYVPVPQIQVPTDNSFQGMYTHVVHVHIVINYIPRCVDVTSMHMYGILLNCMQECLFTFMYGTCLYIQTLYGNLS